MDKRIIIGRLGQDAVLRELKSKKKAISFSVAIDKSYKNADGVKVERTTWANCTKFLGENQTANLQNHLKKGMRVYVSGDPEFKIYYSNDDTSKNEPLVSEEIIIREISILWDKKESESN